MAKKSSVERNKKKIRLSQKFSARRVHLQARKRQALSLEERWSIHRQVQLLPRNSAPTRLHRRCLATGRPRAVYRDFGLSRHVIREMAHACLLPGVTKSSW